MPGLTLLTDVCLCEYTDHGHCGVLDGDTVENDDYATFSLGFEGGAAGAVEVSRVAAGHPNDLHLEVFGSKGAVRWTQERPAEVQLYLSEGPAAQRGYRTIPLGSPHPYIAGGLPIDVSGVGFGQNEGFLFQARAFLEEVAGLDESAAGSDPMPDISGTGAASQD